MRLTSQIALFVWAVTAITLPGSAAESPATQPAPQAAQPPATQPAAYSLHGHVTLSAELELQQPDLSRAVVYLGTDPVLDAMPIDTDRPAVAQQNKTFNPDLLVVARNTEVEFPNLDHFSHNVFSRSAAGPAFDLDRYAYGQSKSRKFQKVGVVQLFCNIHPSMKALIFVTPNRFFTRADAQGQFQLTGIPAGRYELCVWQERCGVHKQAVDLGPGLDQDIALAMPEDRQSIFANDPPRHPDGYGVARGLGVKRERLNLPVVGDSHPAPSAPDQGQH